MKELEVLCRIYLETLLLDFRLKFWGNIMNNYNNILIILLVEGVVTLVIPLILVFMILTKRETINNKTRLIFRGIKEVEKKAWILIIPIIAIFTWFSVRTLMDYTLKDFQNGEGMIRDVSSGKSLITENIIINDQRYYIPRNIVVNKNEGNNCDFVYTKRRKVILEINIKQ